MIDLTTLQTEVVSFRDQRDWKQFHNPKDMAISMLLEASEFLEHFQWKNETEMQRHIAAHKSDVADELSDVFYWVLLIAHDLGIDMEAALQSKLRKNAEKYPIAKSKGKHAKYTEL